MLSEDPLAKDVEPTWVPMGAPRKIYTQNLNVVEVSLDLQEFVCVFPTDAFLLHHPALDAPRVVCPAVHTIFALLVIS